VVRTLVSLGSSEARTAESRTARLRRVAHSRVNSVKRFEPPVAKFAFKSPNEVRSVALVTPGRTFIMRDKRSWSGWLTNVRRRVETVPT
jgi:hypothetical protein